MQSIFIIGYPRSGTTLLLHFLMSSGQFPKYNFDETHFFSHYYKRYGSLKNPKNASRFLSELSKSLWVKNSGLDIEAILKEEPQIDLTYDVVFIKLMEHIAKQQGFSHWIEKTPWHMLYTKEIKKAIPDAKFILIVRDPRDTTLSVNQYGWNKGPFKHILRTAISWRWHMNKVIKDLDAWPEDKLIIKYEDLLQKPSKTVDQISNFLNMKIDINLVHANDFGVLRKSNSSYSASTDTSSPIDRWKSQADDKILSSLNYILGRPISKYEYEKGTQSNSIYDKALISALALNYSLMKNIRQGLFPLVRK